MRLNRRHQQDRMFRGMQAGRRWASSGPRASADPFDHFVARYATSTPSWSARRAAIMVPVLEKQQSSPRCVCLHRATPLANHPRAHTGLAKCGSARRSSGLDATTPAAQQPTFWSGFPKTSASGQTAVVVVRPPPPTRTCNRALFNCRHLMMHLLTRRFPPPMTIPIDHSTVGDAV